MKYNVYAKDKDTEYIYVHIKRSTGDSCKYDWLEVENLNNEYYAKYCTKASLNMFEAKKVINRWKIWDKQYYTTDSPEYCIKKVEDQ